MHLKLRPMPFFGFIHYTDALNALSNEFAELLETVSDVLAFVSDNPILDLVDAVINFVESNF